MTPEEVYKRFEPIYDVKSEADLDYNVNQIADWSLYFLGDPNNDGHFHIRSMEVPLFHRKIYRDLMSEYRLYYISSPSEFGKTTVATMIYPLYRIFYYNEPYIILSSRVDDTAVELLDELKNEIEDNDKLIEVYGVLYDKRKMAWSDHHIELKNGSKVRAVGWGGNVRSRKKKGFRITLFIGDDPEEVADLKSPAILKDHYDWLVRSVVPRTDKEFGKVRIIGTMIGEKCTIAELSTKKRWQGVNYQALVDDPRFPERKSTLPIEKRKSIWEERWPTSFLLREREQAMEDGELEQWMFERMNEPPVYLQKNLRGYRYWNGEFYRNNDQNLLKLEGVLDPIPVYTYVSVDPAFGQSDSADERAIVSFAVGKLPFNTGSGGLVSLTAIWVLEYDFNRMDPDLIIDRVLDLHKKYIYREMYIETIAGQKIYEFMTIRSMIQDNFLIKHPLNPVFVNYHPNQKDDRIYTYFKPLVKLGQLFVRPEDKEIQHELNYFMNAKHLHIIDALQFGCQNSIPSEEAPRNFNPNSRYYQAVQERERLANADWRMW